MSADSASQHFLFKSAIVVAKGAAVDVKFQVNCPGFDGTDADFEFVNWFFVLDQDGRRGSAHASQSTLTGRAVGDIGPACTSQPQIITLRMHTDVTGQPFRNGTAHFQAMQTSDQPPDPFVADVTTTIRLSTRRPATTVSEAFSFESATLVDGGAALDIALRAPCDHPDFYRFDALVTQVVKHRDLASGSGNGFFDACTSGGTVLMTFRAFADANGATFKPGKAALTLRDCFEESCNQQVNIVVRVRR